MKTYFLINPAAGKGKSVKKLKEEIQRVCGKYAVDYGIYLTQAPGDLADEMVRAEARCGDKKLRFYACGGDGTLCEAVNGMMRLHDGSRAELGIIPIGTGNDFVRNFSPAQSFLDIDAQLHASSFRMDLIRANEMYAANMVNIGFDCEVVCKTASLKKKPFVPSGLAYIFGLVGTLVRKPGLHVTLSGGEEENQPCDFLLTTIANGCFCGGGFCSNPYAALDDGMLDMLYINNVTRRKFLSLVGSYRAGTHICSENERYLRNEKKTEIRMYFDRKTNVSLDGEIVSVEDLTLSAVPEAISFLIPAGVKKHGKEIREEMPEEKIPASREK